MSETSIHHIQTRKTARFFTLGNLTGDTRHIWLVLHGYGQLGEYFLRNFKDVQNKDNFIIAPEALSRFYVNETSGRIGATWMTKEDRELEIEDYLYYLDSILDSLNPTIDCRIHVLGFSQGAATACRWALNTHYAVNTLVWWAGFFPPDMQWNSPKYLDENFKTYLLYGNQDEYVNDDLKEQVAKVMNTLPKKPEIITFEGKHEMVNEVLNTLCKSIENGRGK